MATEKRLIDANAVDYENIACSQSQLEWLNRIIEKQPTVDAVEVVHGRWEDFCRGKMCCCSVCKAEFDNTCNDIHGEWHYCPNCGADMRGDGDG